MTSPTLDTTKDLPPVELFYSYSHRDTGLQIELENSLAGLRRQGLIRSWSDRKIGAGEEWAGKIDDALERAHVVLFMLSNSFVGSEYSNDVEFKRALERQQSGQVRIIPVLARPIVWPQEPYCNFEVIPKDAKGQLKAITVWKSRDAGFAAAANRIRDVVVEIRSTLAAAPAAMAPNDEGGVTLRSDKRPRIMPRKPPVALPAPIRQLPVRVRRSLVGREKDLAELDALLTESTKEPSIVAIVGAPGVGKTQVALAYALDHQTRYDVIWWIRGENAVTSTADLAWLAEALKLVAPTAAEDTGTRRVERQLEMSRTSRRSPKTSVADQTDAAEAARAWLAEHGRWLLIFDNVDDPERMHRLLPRAGAGHVLLTSRNAAWGVTAQVLALGALKIGDAADFLVARTGARKSERSHAVSLAKELHGLPLALEGAASFIESHDEEGMTLQACLATLREGGAQALAITGVGDEEQSIARLWKLSTQELGKSSAATGILRTCAFLAADAIPRALFTHAAKLLPGRVAKATERSLAMSEALARLQRLSLVRVRGDTVSVHRAIQREVRSHMSSPVKKRWLQIAVSSVARAFPDDPENPSTWPQCSALHTHALATAQNARELDVDFKEHDVLLEQVGMYYAARAQFVGAREVLQQALDICQRVRGRRSARIGDILISLGNVAESAGKRDEAFEHYERALDAYRAAHPGTEGKSHPDIAIALNNLGFVLEDGGDLAGATTMYEKSLAIDIRHYGKWDPEVAVSLVNLGSVLATQGDYDTAKKYFERALRIDRKAAKGKPSPDVALDLSVLGGVLMDQKKLAEARAHYEDALAINIAYHGPDHPAVASSLLDVASVLLELRDVPAAREHVQRAIAIDRAFYSETDALALAPDYYYLGAVLEAEGKAKEALEAYQNARNIDEQHDVSRMELAADLRAIGRVEKQLGLTADARRDYQHALRLFREIVKPDHERVLEVKRELDAIPK